MIKLLFAYFLITSSLASANSNKIAIDINTNELPHINYQTHYGWIRQYSENGYITTQEVRRSSDGWPDVFLSHSTQDLRESQNQLAQLLNQHNIQLNNQSLQSMLSELENLAPKPLAGIASAVVWPTTNAWSWEWEKTYAKWIDDTVTEEIFEKANLPTDCADVAIALRWIFAREHGLPMASTVASGVLMTNESVRANWGSLPTHPEWQKDQRFLAALKYVLSLAYTHSLFTDSYPIELNKDSFLSGIHMLALIGQTGHTQTVFRRTNDSDRVPFLFIQSTMPTEVRRLYVSGFWWGGPPVQKKSGFLRIRWAIKSRSGFSLQAGQLHPHYSLEQYSPPKAEMQDRPFFMWLMLRLNPLLDFSKIVVKGYADIKSEFNRRKTIVEEGAAACYPNRCRPDTPLYDEHSTPNRDAQLLADISQVGDLEQHLNFEPELTQSIKDEVIFEMDGDPINLKTLMWAAQSHQLKSDPNLPVGERWGLNSTEWIRSLVTQYNVAKSTRTLKIDQARGKCGKGCVPGTKQYIDLGTANIDSLLKLKLQLYSEQLSNLTQLHRENFLNKLASSPLNNEVDNIWKWNSDPRSDAESRWNSLKGKTYFVAPFGHKIVQVNQSRWAVIANVEGQKYLVHLPTGQIDARTFKTLKLAPNSEVAMGCTDSHCLLINLKTGQQFEHAKATGMFWLTDQSYWLFGNQSAQEWVLTNENGSTPKASRQINGVDSIAFATNSSSWMILKDSQNFYVIGKTSNSITTLQRANYRGHIFITERTESGALLSSDKNTAWFTEDQVVEIPASLLPLWFSSSRREIIAQEHGTIVQVSRLKIGADGSIIAREPLGERGFVSGNYLSMLNPTSATMYRIDDGVLRRFPNRNDEHIVLGETTKGLITLCSDRSLFLGGKTWIRLRSHDLNTTHLEAMSLELAWPDSEYLLAEHEALPEKMLVPLNSISGPALMTEVFGISNSHPRLFADDPFDARAPEVLRSAGRDFMIF